MAVSRRLRFEILRRDNHACRYCGRAAPEVALTVDHVVPTALGGSDDPTNLVTACAECNGGKSSVPAAAPLVDDVRADALRWSIAMQEAAALGAMDRENRDYFRGEFDDAWAVWTWADSDGERHQVERPRDWPLSIDQIVRTDAVTAADLRDAVDIAMRSRARDTFRFFCGVLWRQIRDRQAVALNLLAGEDTP